MKETRYEGKPMLRLLECYVLKAIGCLPPETETQLEKLAPNLEKTFGTRGSWYEMIAKRMEFSTDLPEYLRGLWSQNLAATSEQTRLSPEHFAQYVVDSNFSHLV